MRVGCDIERIPRGIDRHGHHRPKDRLFSTSRSYPLTWTSFRCQCLRSHCGPSNCRRGRSLLPHSAQSRFRGAGISSPLHQHASLLSVPDIDGPLRCTPSANRAFLFQCSLSHRPPASLRGPKWRRPCQTLACKPSKGKSHAHPPCPRRTRRRPGCPAALLPRPSPRKRPSSSGQRLAGQDWSHTRPSYQPRSTKTPPRSGKTTRSARGLLSTWPFRLCCQWRGDTLSP
mmetsp:Transcript_20357/g.45132  ORF Transcript_20357/g.45132 Transcript_20357/m.45132 type:complete len:229 (-) Transcript_20357:734-1420(-)